MGTQEASEFRFVYFNIKYYIKKKLFDIHG